MMLKALKWCGVEFAKATAFCVGAGVILVALMTFITYPVEVITALVLLFIAWCLFAFIYG